MTSVLFLGSLSGTSGQRHQSLRRLGYDVTALDPIDAFPRWKWISQVEWHVAPEILATVVSEYILDRIAGEIFDWVLVDSGSLIAPSLLRKLRQQAGKIVNFNHDDPYGQRDRTRFRVYRNAVPEYDLIVVVRKPNVQEAWDAGAKQVLLTFRTFDRVAHAPRPLTPEIEAKWKSEVGFVGTWMPERGPFMRDLAGLGIPISIYGENWPKAPEWPLLQNYWRGSELRGDDYCYAIQCARISLGLLSVGNRDDHTTRSLEIPALGGLFCGDRTDEHRALYREGEEAVFWSNAEECASVCRELLADEPRRREIARRGKARAMADDNSNDHLIRRIEVELSKIGVETAGSRAYS